MNGDLLYVWNAPTYIVKFVISFKNSPIQPLNLPHILLLRYSLQNYCFFADYTIS